jgi:hypothetical protein
VDVAIHDDVFDSCANDSRFFADAFWQDIYVERMIMHLLE